MAEYIEREAVAKLIKSEYIEDLIAEWYEAEFDNVYVISKKELLDIPAADVVEVRRGRWVYGGMIENTWRVFTCSACGCGCVDGGNYCPNCGARMDGGAGDEVD